MIALGAIVSLSLAWSSSVDVPLPGKPSRFDYQSLDTDMKMLYVAHMGDGHLLVFDTRKRTVRARLPGFPLVTGVLVVPELHRVFASVAGSHEVAIVDTATLSVAARVPAGEFPDGLAYSPETGKLFVSDERGGKVIVIDARAGRRLGAVDLGGEVGNTQYDWGSHRILSNDQTNDEIVAIDPVTEKVVARHRLKGGDAPHGLLIHPSKRLAFVACEGNARLLVVDLKTFRVQQVLDTGERPDVLAFDTGLERLYVACESGVVSVFQVRGRTLHKLHDFRVAASAHTIAVDSGTHEVYLPLEDVGGRPVLRILKP